MSGFEDSLGDEHGPPNKRSGHANPPDQQFVSRNEIDLVAKCYFAKHKLIWEVLGYRLKSKIEFHWSGIIVIKAKCSKGGHGTLDIVRLILSRRSRRCGKQHQTLQMVNQEYIDKIMEVWHTRYPLLIVRTGLLPLWRTRSLKKGYCLNSRNGLSPGAEWAI
nr:PREDICTED: uncharacterized protein LOC103977342 isoform X6 [Musa acuminata subsp. malaccensis]